MLYCTVKGRIDNPWVLTSGPRVYHMYKPVNYKAVGWFLLQKIKGRYLVIKYLPLQNGVSIKEKEENVNG